MQAHHSYDADATQEVESVISLFHACKDSVNRAKTQIYLMFSEAQPIFEATK